MRWRLGVATVLVAVAGCADFQYNLAVNSTAAVLRRGSKSLDMEPDVDLARDALPGTLKTIDSFLAAAPEQPILLELTAQAYVQYAFGFLEDDLDRMPSEETPARAHLLERTTSLYLRGADVGLRLVELSDKRFRASWKGDVAGLEGALRKLDKDAAPGLFWLGLAMGSAINLHRDDIDLVADLPKVILVLERAHELDPAYFNYGPSMALGVVYASQGKAVGGDPAKSKAMFDEIIGHTGGRYLMARVLRARFFDTVTLDRAEFEKTLRDVIATPRDVWPEQRLANELAQRRAARYLKQADDLF